MSGWPRQAATDRHSQITDQTTFRPPGTELDSDRSPSPSVLTTRRRTRNRRIPALHLELPSFPRRTQVLGPLPRSSHPASWMVEPRKRPQRQLSSLSLLVSATEDANHAVTRHGARRCCHRRELPAGRSISPQTASSATLSVLVTLLPRARNAWVQDRNRHREAMPTRGSIARPRRRHEAPSKARCSSRPIRAVFGPGRSLDRSSSRLLAPHRLGFESSPRFGSARGPQPTASSPNTSSCETAACPGAPGERTPPFQRVAAPARLDRRRGSSSEELSPNAGARGGIHGNATRPRRPP